MEQEDFLKSIRPHKAAVMIDIDDVHPEGSGYGDDCSGDMDGGAFGYLSKIAEEFPHVKITLFVTPNWNHRPLRIFPRLAVEWGDRFRIDKHPEWCGWLRGKVSSGSFDVAVHGYSHYQLAYPFQSEFKNLEKREAVERLKMSEELLNKAKIPFIKVFRPPGWHLSKESWKALSARKYVVAASADMVTPPSPVSICRFTGPKGKLLYPHKINGIWNITANCDIKRTRAERLERIVKYNGLAVIHGHIQDRYRGIAIRNGVDWKSYENLRKILLFLKNRYGRKILYLGASDIYRKLK